MSDPEPSSAGGSDHPREPGAKRRPPRRERRRSGAHLVYRSRTILAVALAVSNLGGAIIVFGFAVWLLPATTTIDGATLVKWNAVAAVSYTLVATVVGGIWGRVGIRSHEQWLIEDRPPTPTEIDRTLTAPRRLMFTQGILWAIAAVGFTVVNGIIEPSLIARVAMTVIGGGLTTATLTFLLAERITRPVVARALEFDPEPARHAAGVTSRTLLAWIMGTGVPLIGILAAGIGFFITGEGTRTQLAVAMVALGGVGLTVGFVMTLLGVRSVAAPIRSVRKAMTRVADGDLGVAVEVNSSTEVGRLQSGFNRMAAGLRERERLRDLFGQHVGTDVARTALERGIDLRGETRQATVLFVDVVESTSLAEQLPPREVLALLNRLFTVVIEVVDEHHGWINKFVGDAAMAVFGVPEWIEDHPGAALAAARNLATRLAEAVPELDFGIGVSTGTIVAGHLGDERRYEYTIIGDMVNVAARLTDVAKGVPERVLADCAAVQAADPDEATRWAVTEPHDIRGRHDPVAVAVPRGGIARAVRDR